MPASLILRIVFWLWFGGAIAVGHYRVLQKLPPAAVPASVIGLSGLLVLAYFRIAAVRAWVDSLDLRALVLVHVTRFVGVYFLVLYQRGELPREFAVPAGVGDIIVAMLALVVIVIPIADQLRHRAIVMWNVFGFVDILLVIITAARINVATPGELRPLTQLPLSLLPTFLVPLIVATHVILFVRTRVPPAA